jgi:signal transduction histidine kinase
MMTSLRLRLALSYLVVILIGMGIAAPLAWLTIEHLYLETQQANLLAQAQLVAATLQNNQELAGLENLAALAEQPYSQASNALPGIHTRVIEAQDTVVLELQTAALASTEAVSFLPPSAQNIAGVVSPAELLSRPEVAEALAGQPSTAVRRVPLAGNRQILYAAAPVLNGDQPILRLVYIASPLPETGLAALPATTRWQLAGVLLLAVVLATAAGGWLARSLSWPLTQLAQAARAVAAGNLAQTVPDETTIRDLRDLSRAFNVMIANLRQADQLKTAFVADASHELRTPLTIIKGTVETLQDGAVNDPEVRDKFLTSLANETDRLIRLVNDLLTLTRADAGVLKLRPRPVDVTALARARVEHLASLAAQHEVCCCLVQATPIVQTAKVLETAAPSGPPHFVQVLADADRLAQVFDNLLDNAIRHSPPGQTVTVTVTPTETEVTCAVSDKGPGIPAQHLPFIFERFYRADGARSRSQGNSGLGLSIVRAIVLAHGGQISAQNQPGQGTTIVFSLPVCK